MAHGSWNAAVNKDLLTIFISQSPTLSTVLEGDFITFKTTPLLPRFRLGWVDGGFVV